MERLVAGVRRYAREEAPRRRAELERLARDPQRPAAALVTCSDSRVMPELLTGAGPGEVFTVRNAGNVVPPPEEPGGEAASLEFAVEELGVRHVVVLGHTGCAAVSAALAGGVDPAERPALARWLRHLAPVREAVAERHAALPAEARLEQAVRENVLVQLTSLRGHAFVARRRAGDAVALHGWLLDLASGRVEAHDPETGSWSPLGG